MKNTNFGLACEYDNGVASSVSAYSPDIVVEVHKSEGRNTLWWHVGEVKESYVEWSGSHKYDSGKDPNISVNRAGVVVEVHKSERFDKLYYHLGALDAAQKKITFGESHEYDSGVSPSVSINDRGIVVEAHESESPRTLWCRVGTVKDKRIEWGVSVNYDKGKVPDISINNHNAVIEVHKSEGHNTLWCRTGQIDGKNIKWNGSTHFADGVNASVTLNDDNLVTVVFSSGSKLCSRVGQLSGSSVSWFSEKSYFDEGCLPAVSSSGAFVVQTHNSEVGQGSLFYSTSTICDRASWMQDNLTRLSEKTLRQLVLPASHDAAMHEGAGLEVLGKTQDLSIYEQLLYGIRYFDLRANWDGSDFYIYHGPIRGVKLSIVLEDVKKYMEHQYKELIILKFSHYNEFDKATYTRMVEKITRSLGDWLWTKNNGARLADIPLKEYVENGGKVLVVCESARESPKEGIWEYRDGYDTEDGKNILSVFDKYSETTDYEKMKKDQLDKFANFPKSNKKYDLFLLSWTLTPPTGVWLYARDANRKLGEEMSRLKTPNANGAIPNLLYVDYVQYARVTDIAIKMNNR